MSQRAECVQEWFAECRAERWLRIARTEIKRFFGPDPRRNACTNEAARPACYADGVTKTDQLLSEAQTLPPDERRRMIRELALSLEPSDRSGEPGAGVPGQVNGYWFRSLDEIPPERPEYLPTGAVLPEEGRLSDDVECLDLVFVEGHALPLSEAGVYTYAHSGSLTYGDPYYFVPARHWGAVYQAELRDPIEPGTITPRFGAAAANRARPDRKAVIVRLTRVDDGSAGLG